MKKIHALLTILLVALVSGAWLVKDTANPFQVFTGSNTTPTIQAGTDGNVTLGVTSLANTAAHPINGSLSLGTSIPSFSSTNDRYIGGKAASLAFQTSAVSGDGMCVYSGVYFDGTTSKYSANSLNGGYFCALSRSSSANSSFAWITATGTGGSQADTTVTTATVGSITGDGLWTLGSTPATGTAQSQVTNDKDPRTQGHAMHVVQRKTQSSATTVDFSGTDLGANGSFGTSYSTSDAYLYWAVVADSGTTRASFCSGYVVVLRDSSFLVTAVGATPVVQNPTCTTLTSTGWTTPPTPVVSVVSNSLRFTWSASPTTSTIDMTLFQ